MKKSILIIDDEQVQAESLAKGLKRKLSNDYHIDFSFEEEDIINKVENNYFSLVVLDLRMDKFEIDGIIIAKKIIDHNPFAKIIITSAFTDEYFNQLKNILLSGRVLDTIEKEEYEVWLSKISDKINNYHESFIDTEDEIRNALLENYSAAKNENDINIKGTKFEHFVSLLFQSIGYSKILKRVKDKSLNEVDLIIRNEIEDSFLSMFGKYILIECKNKPTDKIDKNTFIVFNNKLKNTSSLSELGVLATTGSFKKTAYLEAMRESSELRKVIFLSNFEFERLINSKDRLEEFKSIIDEQVKDN